MRPQGQLAHKGPPVEGAAGCRRFKRRRGVCKAAPAPGPSHPLQWPPRDQSSSLAPSVAPCGYGWHFLWTQGTPPGGPRLQPSCQAVIASTPSQGPCCRRFLAPNLKSSSPSEALPDPFKPLPYPQQGVTLLQAPGTHTTQAHLCGIQATGVGQGGGAQEGSEGSGPWR